ncbi:MAG: hypothetical protein HYZ21_03815 [Chloroflexi bacterium]|nr:hypothetical protein [Chloroflexota bacterium]
MKRFLPVLPVFVLIFFSSCGVESSTVSPDTGTAVGLTQTAAMWTATPITPSPTTLPNQAVIVDALNGALRGSDPLRDALDAKFHVADVGFDANGNPPLLITLRVHVECEWVIRPACTPERAFVVLIHAFEKEGVRKKVVEQIPTTIEFIQVDAFDHMTQIGSLGIRWQDVLAFTKGEITSDQLAVRVIHFSP